MLKKIKIFLLLLGFLAPVNFSIASEYKCDYDYVCTTRPDCKMEYDYSSGYSRYNCTYRQDCQHVPRCRTVYTEEELEARRIEKDKKFCQKYCVDEYNAEKCNNNCGGSVFNSTPAPPKKIIKNTDFYKGEVKSLILNEFKSSSYYNTITYRNNVKNFINQ